MVNPLLSKRLKDEGFVVLATGSQENGPSKRGRPGKFIVNQDPVVVSARDRNYFNPLVWIDHHVRRHSAYSIAVRLAYSII